MKHQINIKVKPSIKDTLQTLADKQDIPLSKYCNYVLIEHIKEYKDEQEVFREMDISIV